MGAGNQRYRPQAAAQQDMRKRLLYTPLLKYVHFNFLVYCFKNPGVLMGLAEIKYSCSMITTIYLQWWTKPVGSRAREIGCAQLRQQRARQSSRIPGSRREEGRGYQ